MNADPGQNEGRFDVEVEIAGVALWTWPTLDAMYS